MIERIKRHDKIGHYILYCLSFLFYGSLVTALGPLIPFIAEHTGIPQTECSSLFTSRSFGMLIGTILQRVLKSYYKKITNHSLMSGAALLILLSSIVFSITSRYAVYNISIFAFGLAFSVFQLRTNVGIIMINPIQDNYFWLLLAQGMFGVGGLIGPFLVYLFEMKTYIILATAFSTFIIFFYRLESPEQFHQQTQGEGDTAQKIQQSIVPSKIEYLLCLSVFVYGGLQCSFDGWISSYSILAGANDKQVASLFPSIFWITMTLSRFVFACIPGKSSKKMLVLLVGICLTACLSLILIKANLIAFSCYLSSILFGLSMSSIYPLLFVMNDEFGMKLSESQALNMSSAGVISEGIITSFVGYLMNRYHIDFLFISLLILALILLIIRKILLIFYKEKTSSSEKGQRTQEQTEIMMQYFSQ